MSGCYSLMAMLFSLMGSPARLGSLAGRAAPSAASKAMAVLTALGTILFSNSAPIIIIDVRRAFGKCFDN
jgi:hypothetical protein